MPRLPRISGSTAAKAFRKAGWIDLRRHGSHLILGKADSETRLSIPLHAELAPGTLRSLIRDAGFTVEEFRALL